MRFLWRIGYNKIKKRRLSAGTLRRQMIPPIAITTKPKEDQSQYSTIPLAMQQEERKKWRRKVNTSIAKLNSSLLNVLPEINFTNPRAEINFTNIYIRGPGDQ